MSAAEAATVTIQPELRGGFDPAGIRVGDEFTVDYFATGDAGNQISGFNAFDEWSNNLGYLGFNFVPSYFYRDLAERLLVHSVNYRALAAGPFRTNLTEVRVSTTQTSFPTVINPAFQGSVSAAVPEPATWAMLVLGFGLVGAAARRRRTVLA